MILHIIKRQTMVRSIIERIRHRVGARICGVRYHAVELDKEDVAILIKNPEYLREILIGFASTHVDTLYDAELPKPPPLHQSEYHPVARLPPERQGEI